MRSLLITIAVLITAREVSAQKTSFGTADYVRAMKHATDVMVNDVTSPVAASRYYAYISLAANEAACQFMPERQARVGGKSRNFAIPEIPQSLIKDSDGALAIVMSVYQAGTRFLPSGYMLKPRLDSLISVAKKRQISDKQIEATAEIVTAVVNAAINYSYTDGFSKLSGLRRFTPSRGDAFWQPTPPGYMPAIEPYWGTLRPFVIDSVTQIKVLPPDEYDTTSSSGFYKQTLEVYNIGKNLNKEQAAIAMFWDCNPFALQQVGHLEFGIKKISPGGHWMGIAGIACKKARYDIYKTAFVHSILAATMADAFICCWYTKYRYNRVRPETAIRRMFDPTWKPLLQTPPFPEYTSGHSVLSTASAAVLTSIFGDNFSYTDETETEFSIPARKFRSFNQAAEEAAISRLYGGIHFRDAIETGQAEGKQLAAIVISQYKEAIATHRSTAAK